MSFPELLALRCCPLKAYLEARRKLADNFDVLLSTLP
jgi:hypothetical protein